MTLNLVVDAHTSSSERVVPLLTDAGSYLALVPLGVVVFLLFGLLPGARPKLAERRDKLRHWALHAVAVVKAGVFSVVKVIVYIFGVDNLAASGIGGAADWLVVVAGFTIVAASVVALYSDNLKRRLAYSTVSQLAYIVMTTALLVPLSLIGAVLHIAAHAVGKITLFFAAGAIYTAAHKTEVSELDGIGRRMPWTMGAFAIATLSMIGLPPAVGFVSKWYMLSGAMAAQHWLAVAVIVVSTLLNAGYFLPIVYRAFFVAPRDAPHDPAHGEAPLPMVLALGATSAATVLLFFLPDVPLALARQTIAP